MEKKDSRAASEPSDRATACTVRLELHRRMTYMGISRAAINTASEKSQIIDLLLELSAKGFNVKVDVVISKIEQEEHAIESESLLSHPQPMF